MNKRILNKKELKNLQLEFINLEKDAIVEELDGRTKILLLKNVPIAFDYNGRWIPTLKGLRKPIAKIKVDQGAVKFVLSGAHIMRPGVTSIDENIKQDNIILVMSPENKPLAIGIALFDSESMIPMKTGKVVLNLHQFDDYMWNFSTI